MKESKNLAIIGASYLQLPLIVKAKDMGYTTHVFAWATNDVGETAADFFYPISIVEKDEILDKCREIGICGICSIASDLAMITVNYVAEKMNLSGNSVNATLKSTNKHLMRQAFESKGDPSPKSLLVDENTDLDVMKLEYPVIVKPTDRSGSRGIRKINDSVELKSSVEKAIKESFEKKALVEEFVEGKEYSVEYISFNGKHYFLAVTEKETTGEPYFVETGHKEPAILDEEIIENIKRIVSHALDTLEIKNGASHSEIKVNDGKIKIIEIGGRMGGDCIGSHLVYYSTGIDYVRAVIDVACGNEPDLMPINLPISVESKFIISEEDLQQYLRIKDTDKLIETVDYHPENIGKMTDSSNRAGCYIIRGT